MMRAWAGGQIISRIVLVITMLSMHWAHASSSETSQALSSQQLSQSVKDLRSQYETDIYNDPAAVEASALSLLKTQQQLPVESRQLWLDVMAYYSESLIMQGKLELLNKTLNQHLKVINTAQPSGALAILLNARGYACMYLYVCDPEPWLLQAIQVADQQSAIDPLLTGYSNLSSFYIDNDRLEEAFKYLLLGIGVAKRNGKGDHEANFYAAIGNLYHLLGGREQSLTYNQKAADMFESQGLIEQANRAKLILIAENIEDYPDVAEGLISEVMKATNDPAVISILRVDQADIEWKYHKNYDKAFSLFSKIRSSFFEELPLQQAVDYVARYGIFLVKQNKTNKAEALLKDLLQQELSPTAESFVQTHSKLGYLRSLIYEEQGMYEAAFYALQSHVESEINRFQVSSRGEFSSRQLLIELERMKSEQQALTNLNVMQGENIEEQQKTLKAQQYMGLALVVLLSVTIILLVRQIVLKRALYRTSNIDAVTGIYNRRCLQTMFDAHKVKHGVERVICILDLDYFKLVNDRHGHLIGDRLLAHVGTCMRQVFENKNTLFGRWGGEEFLIVSWLNETEFNALLVQFNRVLKQFSHENLELRQTASYGISIIKDDSGASLENIIEYTDKLLYESKRSGRDTMTYGCIL